MRGFFESLFAIRTPVAHGTLYYKEQTTVLPMLDTPIISVIKNETEKGKITITITPVSNALNYRIYIDGSMVQTITDTTYEYTFITNGNYEIRVQAFGDITLNTPSKKSEASIISINELGIYLMGNRKFILANMKKILIGE